MSTKGAKPQKKKKKKKKGVDWIPEVKDGREVGS